MKNIIEILETNQLRYRDYQTECFNIWCALWSDKNYIPVRIFQKSEELFAWYVENWNKHTQLVFMVENKDFIDAKIKQKQIYRELFAVAVPSAIACFYPITLINKLKKLHYEKTLGFKNKKVVETKKK